MVHNCIVHFIQQRFTGFGLRKHVHYGCKCKPKRDTETKKGKVGRSFRKDNTEGDGKRGEHEKLTTSRHYKNMRNMCRYRMIKTQLRRTGARRRVSEVNFTV